MLMVTMMMLVMVMRWSVFVPDAGLLMIQQIKSVEPLVLFDSSFIDDCGRCSVHTDYKLD